METTKRTYRDINRFMQTATALLQACTGESQFKYALTRVLKSCRSASEKYDDLMAEINITHGSVDDKGNILVDPNTNGFVFTPEKMVSRRKKEQALLDTEVEVGFYHIDLKRPQPVALNGLHEAILEGFVFPVADEPPPDPPKDPPAENTE